MKQRQLGKDGATIPALGLGAMSLSGPYGSVSEQEALAVIHRALELGATHIDTAEAYGDGQCEEFVGKAIAGRRADVFLATKFAGGRPQAAKAFGGRGRPEAVRKSIEGSLRRLNVDYVDLYYLHRVDPETPIEDTVGAMAALVEEGKVRYLGLSEAAPATIRRACAVHQISALQTEYSMFSREPEGEIFKTIRELGVGFVSYSPLGRGMLTGRYSSASGIQEGDVRQIMPRFQGENLEHNARIVTEISAIADGLGVTPAQLALAWVLAQGNDIVTIPGTGRIANLESNVAAAEVELSADTLKRIDGVLGTQAVLGERYPEPAMQYVNG